MLKYFILKIVILFILLLQNAFAEFSWRTDFLSHYTFTKNLVDAKVINPTNSYTFELRSDLKEKNEYFDLVYRPLFSLKHNNVDKNYQKNLSATEIFLAKSYLDRHYFSFGKTNIQWGPTEFLSWSNPLVHFNPKSKSFFFLENGHHLLRYDYTPQMNILFSAMIKALPQRLNSGTLDDFIVDTTFRPEALIRGEYFFKNNIDMAGLTFSKTQLESYHLGIYGKLQFTDSWSLYTDSRFSLMPKYYTLTTANYLGQDYLSWANNKSSGERRLQKFFDIGLRFESTFDYRFEYIFNEYGLGRNELKQVTRALLINNPFYLRNAKILSNRGSELIGKNYLYQSLRVPDLGFNKKFIIFLRHTLSLQDYTSNLLACIDFEANNHWVWYLETQSFIGPSTSEFSTEGRFSFNIGPKYSF